MNRLKFVLFYNDMTLIYLTIAEFFYEILAHSGQFLDDGSIYTAHYYVILEQLRVKTSSSQQN